MKLPTDMPALRGMGIEAWRKDAMWPVSERDFHAILDELYDQFDLMSANLPPHLVDLIFCDLRYLTRLAQHVHAASVRRWCEENGVELLVGDDSKSYYDIDLDFVGRYNNIDWSSWQRLLFQGRRFAKRLRFGENLSLLKRLLKLPVPAPVWSLGSFDFLKRDYLNDHSVEACDHPYIQTLIGSAVERKYGLSPDDEALLSAKLHELIENMALFCRQRFGIELEIEPFVQTWLRRLRPLWAIYESISKRSRLPRLMLLSDLGNPFHRAVAYALRARDIDVIGFTHGHNPGFVVNRAVPHGQHSLCSHYYCPTERTAQYHREILESSVMQRSKDTQFFSLETTEYSDLWEQYRDQAITFPLRSIMVVGSQLVPLRSMAGTGEFFIFKVDLEIRIVELLKRQGYHVTYKPHPQYLAQSQGVFENIVDKVEPRPFEQVMLDYDAYVFTHPLTTPFGLSLCTNKPIALIDVEERDWEPKGYELLKRRCHMVPARFSEATNMVEFDEQNLLDFLALRPSEPNLDYLRLHMFPMADTDNHLAS